MNNALWQQHLQQRIDTLEQANQRLRVLLSDQRGRTEFWKNRAEIQGALVGRARRPQRLRGGGKGPSLQASQNTGSQIRWMPE